MTAEPATTEAHVVSVVWERGRYPWRAVCSCSWREAWGYAAEHAAQTMADEHAASVAPSPGP